MATTVTTLTVDTSKRPLKLGIGEKSAHSFLRTVRSYLKITDYRLLIIPLNLSLLLKSFTPSGVE